MAEGNPSDAHTKVVIEYASAADDHESAWARWARKPVGWPLHGAVLVASLSILIAMAAPQGWSTPFLWGVVMWLAIGACWLMRAVLALGYSWCDRTGPSRSRHWFVAPVSLVVLIGLCLLEIPLYTAFALSRPAMNRVAHQITTSPAAAPAPTWIGLFPAEEIERTPFGMQFTVRGLGSISADRGGFAWSPNGPPKMEDARCTHLGGAWYVWREYW